MSAQFTFVPLETVVKQPKAEKSPSERAKIAQAYQDAITQAVENHTALSIAFTPRPKDQSEVEPGVEYDSVVTLHNRIEAAAKALGMPDKIVHRKARGENTIVVYHIDHEAEVLAES